MMVFPPGQSMQIINYNALAQQQMALAPHFLQPPPPPQPATYAPAVDEKLLLLEEEI